MPWWSWMLIWVALVALLLAVLIGGAIWLWRHLAGIGHEAARLADIQAQAAQLAEEAEAARETATIRRPVAIGRDSARVREYHEEQRRRLRERREARRCARLERARALLAADPQEFTPRLEAWRAQRNTAAQQRKG